MWEYYCEKHPFSGKFKNEITQQERQDFANYFSEKHGGGNELVYNDDTLLVWRKKI